MALFDADDNCSHVEKEQVARDFLAVDIEDEPRKILDELVTLASSALEVS